MRGQFVGSEAPGEGYSRSYTIFLGDLLLVINVHFREGDAIWFRVLLSKRFVGWSNCFTGSAPVSVEISYDDARCGEEFAELSR